EESRQEKWFR
ncbi:ABC-type transport system, periplasmic component domain protein, partial [Vibrio parahaemolyticus IDH02189]